MTLPFVLGGGSTINGMMNVRGSSEDYDSWADQVGDPAWNYSSVLHYFKRAERNLDPAIAEDSGGRMAEWSSTDRAEGTGLGWALEP